MAWIKSASLERLIEAWQAGRNREEISREIFDRYGRRVASFFYAKTSSAETAHDLTQEAFLRIFRSLEGFRGDAGFETWLFQIARNLWRNHLRNRGRSKRRGEEVAIDGSIEEPVLSLELAQQSPLERALVAEQTAALRQALTSLPDRQRALILLQIDQELTYPEIAEVMRMKVGTVKSQLFKARNQLRTTLGERYAGIVE